jgi:hypothetical protein
MPTSTLRLYHELLLLALADDTGKVAFGGMLTYGLGGAILTELLLEQRLEIVEEGTRVKRRFVQVADPRPLGEPMLDAVLAKLRDAKRRASPSAIVSRFGQQRQLRHEIARELCRAGVLRETEQQILLLFRRRLYPTIDSRPERALIKRVRDTLDAGKKPSDRTAALIGLASASGSLAALYDRKTLRALKPRLKAIADSSEGSRAVREAIAAAQAAVTAAMVAATVAAT